MRRRRAPDGELHPDGNYLLAVPRAGRTYYYFRPGTALKREAFPVIRLSDNLADAKAQARNLAKVTADPSAAALYRNVRSILKAARRRARQLRRPFEITEPDVFECLLAQNGRCAVSAMAFTTDPNSADSPFAPVLTPREPAQGYRAGNVMVVTAAAEAVLRPWGEDVLRTLAHAVARGGPTRAKAPS